MQCRCFTSYRLLLFMQTVFKQIVLTYFFSTFEADDLFTEIRKEFIEGLEEQDWMDDQTRDQARLKVR